MPPRIPHPDPGTPDTAGPLRYIWWLVRCQPARVLRGGFFGTAWMVALSLRPYLIARAIDDGLRRNDFAALTWWVVAIIVAGIVLAYLGIMRHRTMTMVREDATARSAEVLLRHVSRVGAALPRSLRAGEVATVGGSDLGYISQVLTLTGPGVGAVLAYLFVAGVLWRTSPTLAAFVLLGTPASVAVILPLLRRMERTETDYRAQQGDVTAQAGDIVAGLRVLAGVGGRDRFARAYARRSQELLGLGYRVGAASSWIEASTIAIPGLYLAAVVWLAARMAAAGTITVGDLVAVYGYVAALIVPVWFMIELSRQLIRGRVSARRAIAVLNVRPDDVGARGRRPAPGRDAQLHDPASGLLIRPGEMLGIATGDGAGGLALADRLGRFVASDVTWGGVPLAEIDLAKVRAAILVADHDSYLFAGQLIDLLAVPVGGVAADSARGGAAQSGAAHLDSAQLGAARLDAALRAASAEDVVETVGRTAVITTQGRNLSGGQRQRIRLARALAAEPEILVLVDPTSAVDANTEARIAQRLGRARAGRTTVIIATSPILLAQADRVAYLRDGRVVASGSHTELTAARADYRALVSRGAEDLEDVPHAGPAQPVGATAVPDQAPSRRLREPRQQVRR